MNRSDTPEQHELRVGMRRFLTHPWPAAEVRRAVDTDTGPNPQVWGKLAGQLGVAGLAVPQDLGGSGASVQELAVVAAELGRSLLPSPFLGSAVMATTALQLGADPAVRNELVPALAAGELTAALVLDGAHGRPDPQEDALTATVATGGRRLSGRALFVIDGPEADLLVVIARTECGPTLLTVDPKDPAVSLVAIDTLDRTRQLASVTFTDCPARLAGPEGEAGPTSARTLDLARVILAAEQLGGMERCLEMVLAHVRERLAFGRPIGSFQAVRHSCVDMFLEVELARAAVRHAVTAAVECSPELPLLASVAQAHCSTAYQFVAAQSIHLHGGIGFTWEHDAQLFFKRAVSSVPLLGDPAYHRARIAAHLMDEGQEGGDDLAGPDGLRDARLHPGEPGEMLRLPAAAAVEPSADGGGTGPHIIRAMERSTT